MAQRSGFRDALCSEIPAYIDAVAISEIHLVVTFTSGTAFVISLQDEDYTGPEALNFIASR
jgi:hypothetical protein